MADTLVLCYHAVSETWDAALAVTPRLLAEQLGHLVSRGYRGITFSEVLAAPPGRTVAVTFDDAYRSIAELAAPVLAELGLPGTVFVPTSYVGSETAMVWPGIDSTLDADRHELVPMGWDELALLANHGWEVGSHTRTHPRLVELSDDQLDRELRGSREEIENRLSRPCTSLAYPYGCYDRRVALAARQAGYRVAGILDRRLGPPTAHAWPRIGVYRRDDLARFRFKVGALGRSQVATAAAIGLRRLGVRGATQRTS